MLSCEGRHLLKSWTASEMRNTRSPIPSTRAFLWIALSSVIKNSTAFLYTAHRGEYYRCHHANFLQVR